MGTPLHVLIVEDSESDMILMLRELQRHEVDLSYVWVQTAEDMKAALNTQTFDVVLSDYSMPTFGAVAALSLTQATGLDIPFIIVSGTVGEEVAVAAMKAGAHDFFSKSKLTLLMPAIEREMHEADERRQRRRAEDELVQSENRFSSIFHRSPLPIVITRLDNFHIVDMNDAFVNTMGYRRDELVGHAAFELGLWIDPELRMDAIVQGSEVQNFHGLEIQGRSKSGNTLDLLASAELIDLGDTPLIVTMLHDVTEKKQMEQELLETELLRVELEKERELIQLKERFISVVSHEFRTPLSIIISSGSLVEKYYDRLSPEEQLKYVHDMLSQSEYMVELIDNVLTVNKARAGRLEFKPAPIDLLEFCQTTVERIRVIGKGEHRLDFVHEGNLSDVEMDVKLLQHILVNLMTNAVKYSPEASEVRLEVHRQGDEVVIQVSDEGIGIPPEAQARLFEPFHRADNVGDVSGTGLGLTIVKESVDLHFGTIQCESKAGIGTRFIVRLPASAGPTTTV